jgi:hypothetical protein
MLDQRAWASCDKAVFLTSMSNIVKEAVNGSRTSTEELAADIIGQGEITMTIEGGNELGHKRNEPFGAEAVGGLPDDQ